MRAELSRCMRKYVAASIFFVLTFSLVGLLSLYTPILEILELKGYDFMMSVIRGPVPDLPPRTRPPSKLDPGPFGVHCTG